MRIGALSSSRLKTKSEVPSQIPRVVLDIHVVLDFWHFNDGRTERLRRQVENGALQVVTSEALDEELCDVMSRSAFTTSRQRVLQQWQTRATTVEVHQRAAWRCRDPDDQKLLDLAVSAKALALITRDKALLVLARRAATTSATVLHILTPENFGARFDAAGEIAAK